MRLSRVLRPQIRRLGACRDVVQRTGQLQLVGRETCGVGAATYIAAEEPKHSVETLQKVFQRLAEYGPQQRSKLWLHLCENA